MRNTRAHLTQTDSLPQLSKTQQARLGQASLKGDKTARETLYRHNTRYVTHLVNRHPYTRSLTNMPEHVNDLHQAGLTGLWRALQDWNPNTSTLSTYAKYWINLHIQREAQTQNTISLPHEGHETLQRLKQGKTPNHPHTAETLHAYQTWEASQKSPNSLDKPITGHNSGDGAEIITLQDILPQDLTHAEEQAQAEELTQRIRDAISTLPPLQQAIITARYYGPQIGPKHRNRNSRVTLTELGKTHSLTRERIRQIEQDAIKVLRKKLANPPKPPSKEAP